MVFGAIFFCRLSDICILYTYMHTAVQLYISCRGWTISLTSLLLVVRSYHLSFSHSAPLDYLTTHPFPMHPTPAHTLYLLLNGPRNKNAKRKKKKKKKKVRHFHMSVSGKHLKQVSPFFLIGSIAIRLGPCPFVSINLCASNNDSSKTFSVGTTKSTTSYLCNSFAVHECELKTITSRCIRYGNLVCKKKVEEQNKSVHDKQCDMFIC